ncbi:hypothetical protein [Ruegeria atlantica]|uniref:hypothetical protein n=1 Tax=Ruegeria atlantica TaxID=81569 RepID=UPI00147A65D5|nr:hypothetical protein [Ruegeria atlantica]
MSVTNDDDETHVTTNGSARPVHSKAKPRIVNSLRQAPVRIMVMSGAILCGLPK